MSDVVVLVPVLRRPHRVAPLLKSIYASSMEEIDVLFLPDYDDHEERAAIAECGARQAPINGNYSRKINLGVLVTDHPLVFLGADDLHFHPGWLDVAREAMADGVGVVGTNDLCNPRTGPDDEGHSTHSLVARWYARLGTIDEVGKLLHESYPHEFVDDELIATARHRGAYRHVPECVVEHLHPTANKAPMDDIYAARESRMRTGRAIFEARRCLWER